MKAAGLGQAFYTASMCADSIVSFVKLANSSESDVLWPGKLLNCFAAFPAFPALSTSQS